MFSLQKIFGKEKEIFRLLEASAQQGRDSVQALVRASKTTQETLVLDEFARLRGIGRQVTQEIGSTVYTMFVTALDREDLETLSIALYKIPKMVDKFAERLLTSPPGARKVDFSVQIGMLERAAGVVIEMVRTLRMENVQQIGKLKEELDALENEADKHMMKLYASLFSGKHEIMEVIALKDLYEQLERVIDACQDAGSAIAHIGLKNS